MALGIVTGVLVVFFGAWTAVGYSSTKGIETPAYTLVEKRGTYELRDYAGYIRAEVTLEGGYRETLYGGFRDVAGYIFGDNTGKAGIAMTAPVLQEGPSEKIAMTAPVLQEPAPEKIAMTAPVLHEEQGERYTISFVMPAEYTLDTLPTPNNAQVSLREVPPTRFAVARFGGYARERKAERRIAALEKQIAADGLVAAGPAIIAQYDPPWTPFYMRKNEIQIPIADEQPAGR